MARTSGKKCPDVRGKTSPDYSDSPSDQVIQKDQKDQTKQTNKQTNNKNIFFLFIKSNFLKTR